MSPDCVAQCAQLALLFELSSGPKPGNVDRCHDFYDIEFHHFVVSAVSVYPIFRAAASDQSRVGRLLLDCIRSWRNWGIPGNTHFGSLVLMIPLAMASSRSGLLREELTRVLKDTTVEDALDFYRAFEMVRARVVDVSDFSLKDPATPEKLRRERKTLLDLMYLSNGHDLVAKEWSTGYKRSFRFADKLEEKISKHGLNEGIVRIYLEALSEEPDSLVQAKFGSEKARELSRRAAKALEDRTLASARELDEELLEEDVNPGSTADLIVASLFITLLRGLRF